MIIECWMGLDPVLERNLVDDWGLWLLKFWRFDVKENLATFDVVFYGLAWWFIV
jgi:hypothetical protein